jgi:RNA recognition motif-containing protein
MTGLSRGVGFVLFSTRDEAESAMAALNNVTPSGFTNPLQVQFAEDKAKNREQKHAAVVPTNPVPLPHQMPPLVGGYPMGTYPNFGMGYGMPPAGGNLAAGPMRNQMSKHRYNPMAAAAGGYGVPPVPVMAPPPVIASNGAAPGHVLFAYNIGAETTEAQLCQLFASYGSVTKTDVIRDPQTGLGRGFGFVTMPNYHEALTAIQNLNGYCYATKPLQVSFKSAKTGKQVQ